MFEKIKSMILSVLGLTELPVEGKKLNFSEEQLATLKEEFGVMGGDEFIQKFTEAYEKTMADQSAQETANAQEAMIARIQAENKRTIDALNAKIDALSKKPEVEEAMKLAEESAKELYQVDMKAKHNTIAAAYLDGDSGPFLAAADQTIDVADLKSEFGSTATKDKNFIRRQLTIPTMSMKFMTTVLAEERWRAVRSILTSVVQQFTAKWTPLGKGKFVPMEIVNRRHKINVEFVPSDITGTWISYLYDEGLTPKEMPITKFMIIDVMNKAEEDREMLLIGIGRYVELLEADVNENDPGQETGLGMDGFLTILESEYEKPDTAVNFRKLGIIDETNIVDKMRIFVDSIDRLFKNKKLPIFNSDDHYRMYKRSYQDLYPATKNEDAKNDVIDFSRNKLQPLDSMSTSKHFFITPKENFIRLKHKNNGTSRVFVENLTVYKVGLAAEWREAVGFAYGEPVFAYIDPITVINRYAETDDASKLQIYMLEDAEIENINEAKLADYKVAIAAEDGIANQAALQIIVDTVNAA
jgi:hypothetical protein